MSNYIFQLANKNDDAELRSILRNNPMDGEISVAFQRDPDYFRATKIGNQFNQIMVAKDKRIGKIVGLGSRSIFSAYINGKTMDLGYLSGLRLNNSSRNSFLLSKGYEYLKSLHGDKRTPLYITTIMDDNTYVKDLLTSKRVGLPTYHNFGTYHSVAIPLSRKKRNNCNGLKIERGSRERLDGIIDCLHRNGVQKQFYPIYTMENFISNNGILRDFRIEDFYVALKNDEIVGVLAKWDQTNFKQTIITSYRGKMKRIKSFYNFYSIISGYPLLPKPNSQLNFFYVCFIAIDSNNSQIFRELLQAVYNDAVGSNYSYFLVGLHSRDPLLGVLREYRSITYKSCLYVVYWQDGEGFFRSLDSHRIPHLEICML